MEWYPERSTWKHEGDGFSGAISTSQDRSATLKAAPTRVSESAGLFGRLAQLQHPPDRRQGKTGLSLVSLLGCFSRPCP